VDMEVKELGNTGVMVPEIGLGTWKYTGGVEPLRRGIALGAFLIDTAELYRTEDVVGQAVIGSRDRVFLATKVMASHLRYDQVMRAARAACASWAPITLTCTRSIGPIPACRSRRPCELWKPWQTPDWSGTSA
jgi:diketogulonate reductase-like aldo/keto reductase